MSNLPSLAIYSDSWADPLVRDPSEMDNKAWSEMLSDEYNVTNFARGGTSIYYSYQKFLETYKDFDKIIFVVTDYYRWFHLVNTPLIKSPWGDFNHSFAGPGMIEYWRKDPMFKKHIDTELSLKFDALEKYFGYLNDSEFDKTICNLMLNDVHNKRPDTIFIQGGIFPEFFPLIKNETALAQFAMRWIKNWPDREKEVKDGYGFFPWKEARTICHFSKEVNLAILKCIKESLKIGKWDPIIPDFIPAEHNDFNYYYDYNTRIW